MATGKSFKMLTFAKKSSVFLSLLLLPNIVAIFVAASIVVVIIASNDETRCIISKVKTLVAMGIMKTEANDDGSNIKWSLEMVFEGACSLVFGCFLGCIGVGLSVFINLRAFLSPAVFEWCFFVGVFLTISDCLEEVVFESIFEWLFLTFIYHYVSIITFFCLVFVDMFSVVIVTTYVHYYKGSVWLF